MHYHLRHILRVSVTALLCSSDVVVVAASSSPSSTANFSAFVDSQVLTNPFPYYYPQENATAAQLFAMPACKGVVIEDATLDELQQYLSNGTLTSVDLVHCYQQRSFQTGEYINSVLEMNPDALSIAATLDEYRKQGFNSTSPLYGIPFLVKDNFASKDKLQTCAGSWALQGNIVPRDAFVVRKLREAGAILMGKSTLSEWADMRTSNYSEGYSARGGQARNSYNFTVNPGGSSTGSAIAVANNVIPFALGTETDGSVINPAERNAIVGIKPTVGLTSRAGVIPITSHMDTVGTFGKTVRDAVYVLDAIYGVDARDNYTSAQTGKTPKGGYVSSLAGKEALKGARFGIPWLSFWQWADQEQLDNLLNIVEILKDAGATIVNGTELPYWQTIVSPNGWNWDYGSTRGYPNESEFSYVKVDFYNDIKTYLAELTNTDMHSLEDLVQYNIDNLGTEGGTPGIQPAWGSGQDQFLDSLATKGIMNSTYWEALSFCHRTTREDGIDAALAANGSAVDALLAPPDNAQSYQIAAQAGYPVVTIPAWVHSLSGMPYGFSFMGTAFSEAILIRYASATEDLLISSGSKYQRANTKPQWEGYLLRNLPLANQCFGC
ncbi:hypothetical protein M409DRAFT_61084 [Zasmidium cellare ATCC 36951]|uniref:Amidase domain-containing protein n=1 Tax=Zasmidium cellare ATCC 36951 TaxID=1080233 RepID=A0A6A6BWE7_ZASCE|nr:uncharacterized protein M409DRAFT_61084 [Zasmidium cellare ATCC 36951]KAF2159131.1 hypothetical protein M409DRAFT_61084 [Zasmidium cellare ATCC 36951]